MTTAQTMLEGETIQILLDLLNPLHGDLDKQTYDAKVAMEFDMPPEYAHDVTVTAQQERDLTQAVCILENRLRQAAAPQGREALEKIKCYLYSVPPDKPWIAECRAI